MHMHLFEESEPQLKVKSSQLPPLDLDELNEVFKDQIIIFCAELPPDYATNHHVNSPNITTILGLYRIEKIVKTKDLINVWSIQPYKDGWVRFPKLATTRIFWNDIHDKFLKIKSISFSQVLEQMYYVTESNGVEFHSEGDRGRLNKFVENFHKWQEIANSKMANANEVLESHLDPKVQDSAPMANNAFTALKDLKLEKRVGSSEATKIPAGKQKDEHLEKGTNLIPVDEIKDPSDWRRAVQHLPERLQMQFELAWESKPIIILSGEPGSGKSHIARNLGDSDNMHIVTVASNWQSVEDLLGYYNPISQKFHPSPVTKFLIECEKAWDKGDRTVKVVVLEEMNLAQPEHYMSEILAKTQYDPEDKPSRTLNFPGEGMEGGDAGRTGVYLSPAIKFVGTVNTDHSVRKLTQRVIDRSAVVKVAVDPKKIFQQLKLEVSSRLLQCILELNNRLEGRFRFSYRTGKALNTAINLVMPMSSTNGEALNELSAFDYVLMQEVWPRVSTSFQSDFSPAKIIDELESWINSYQDDLTQSYDLILDWKSRCRDGKNIDTLGV